jgi:hypothetical protein
MITSNRVTATINNVVVFRVGKARATAIQVKIGVEG